jgi:hypothetical protein
MWSTTRHSGSQTVKTSHNSPVDRQAVLKIREGKRGRGGKEEKQPAAQHRTELDLDVKFWRRNESISKSNTNTRWADLLQLIPARGGLGNMGKASVQTSVSRTVLHSSIAFVCNMKYCLFDPCVASLLLFSIPTNYCLVCLPSRHTDSPHLCVW